MDDILHPSTDDFVAPGRKSFETERLILLPLKPDYARELVRSLLADPGLAAVVPWMKGKSVDDAAREAFRIELECNAGQTGAWGIIERRSQVLMGALLAGASLSGTQLEVLLAADYWHQGYSQEAQEPVIDWLQEEGPIVWGFQ